MRAISIGLKIFWNFARQVSYENQTAKTRKRRKSTYVPAHSLQKRNDTYCCCDPDNSLCEHFFRRPGSLFTLQLSRRHGRFLGSNRRTQRRRSGPVHNGIRSSDAAAIANARVPGSFAWPSL